MVGHEPQLPDAGKDSASHFSLDHPSTLNINLRNPLPLSAAQEAQVKQLYYKRVRLRCDPEIKEFAACAVGRTITATWTCRKERLKMNSCMIAHATAEEEDAAREEWFASIQERRRKREEEAVEVEKRRQEVIELTRKKAEQERLEAEGKKTTTSSPVVDDTSTSKKKGWW